MSVNKLKEGKWVVDFRDSNRRKHRIIVRGNKATAKAKEQRLKELAEEEILFPGRKTQRITFRQLAENYFKLHGPQLRARETWEYMSNRILEQFGNYTMQQLTSKELQVFYNEILDKGRTPSTAKKYITLISAIINLADKHGDFVGRNPCKAVDMKPGDNQRTEYLSKERIQLLKKNCRADVWPVVFCALCTGMRRGEILGLEWDRVDLVNDNITLLKTKSAKKREIPILPELKDMFLSMDSKNNGKVFAIGKNAFECCWKRMLKKLAISNLHFHDLRHTFASYFMMNGGVITDLQQILGHSSLKMTQRYAHLSPAHLKKSMQVMAGTFGTFNNTIQ